jgi:hypothetical protein
MKRIAINPRFINEAGKDLIPSKIHTIRKNYDYWKMFERKEIELFTWEGKPYRSEQKPFCLKQIISVQEVEIQIEEPNLWIEEPNLWFNADKKEINLQHLSLNDGFEKYSEFLNWFASGNYKSGKMAILHFTDYRY